MFCYQCEQTAGQKGCSVAGVCGKSNEVALLQDLLFYTSKGLACYAHELAKKDVFEEKLIDFISFISCSFLLIVVRVSETPPFEPKLSIFVGCDVLLSIVFILILFYSYKK